MTTRHSPVIGAGDGSPMTPTATVFLQLPLVSSCLREVGGELHREEYRKDPDTGRTLRGLFKLPATKRVPS